MERGGWVGKVLSVYPANYDYGQCYFLENCTQYHNKSMQSKLIKTGKLFCVEKPTEIYKSQPASWLFGRAPYSS
jgi:hypothetical protein